MPTNTICHPEYFSLPQDSTYFHPHGRAVEAKQVSETIHRSLLSKSALVRRDST